MNKAVLLIKIQGDPREIKALLLSRFTNLSARVVVGPFHIIADITADDFESLNDIVTALRRLDGITEVQPQYSL